MNESVIQLYPLPGAERELKGLYLAHDLRRLQAGSDQPFIYTDFVTSLDGRIAIPRPGGEGLMVPKNTSNARDWRLYQELVAQADFVLTTDRYMRDLNTKAEQPISQSNDAKFADLKAWRAAHGLPPNHDLGIISSALDFSIPQRFVTDGKHVIVFTTAKPNAAQVTAIESQGAKVIVAGANSVDGQVLRAQLTTLGYKTVFSSAGPKVMHLLLSGNALSRLYLTFANRMLGSEKFASVVDGPLLEPAAGFTLETLYFDPHGLDGLGQLFACYKPAPG